MAYFNDNSVDKPIIYLHLDTETTGLDSEKCGLVEVAGLFEMNGQVLNEFELLINPYSYPFPVEVQEKALAVNNRTIPEIQTFNDQAICLDWLISMSQYLINQYQANRIFIVGYNISFDMNFIQAWFKVNNKKFVESFQYKSIDVLQLVMTLSYLGILDPFDNNLKDMCLKFDIDLTNAHTAIADIRATRELFHKLIGTMNFVNLLNPKIQEDNIKLLNSLSHWVSKPMANKLGINQENLKPAFG